MALNGVCDFTGNIRNGKAEIDGVCKIFWNFDTEETDYDGALTVSGGMSVEKPRSTVRSQFMERSTPEHWI